MHFVFDKKWHKFCILQDIRLKHRQIKTITRSLHSLADRQFFWTWPCPAVLQLEECLQNVCYGFVGTLQANKITQPIVSILLKSSVIFPWKVLRKKRQASKYVNQNKKLLKSENSEKLKNNENEQKNWKKKEVKITILNRFSHNCRKVIMYCPVF